MDFTHISFIADSRYFNVPPCSGVESMAACGLHDLAAALDRKADILLAEGRREQAERLNWHAAALREGAQA